MHWAEAAIREIVYCISIAAPNPAPIPSSASIHFNPYRSIHISAEISVKIP
jgi:hypothetical protein